MRNMYVYIGFLVGLLKMDKHNLIVLHGNSTHESVFLLEETKRVGRAQTQNYRVGSTTDNRQRAWPPCEQYKNLSFIISVTVFSAAVVTERSRALL